MWTALERDNQLLRVLKNIFSVCLPEFNMLPNKDLLKTSLNINTFSWGPSMAISTNPRAIATTLKSITQPPFAKRYATDCLTCWTTAKMKSFNTLNGSVVRVKFSISCCCFSQSPAKSSNCITYWNLMSLNFFPSEIEISLCSLLFLSLFLKEKKYTMSIKKYPH